MSLLWIEGFEGYGSTAGNAPAPSDVLSRKYTVYGESNMDIEAGRIDGYCLELGNGSCYIETPAINTDATIIVGFAMKVSSFDTDTFLNLYDGVYSVSLRHTVGGEVDFYVGGSKIATTSGAGLSAGSWYWYELKVVVNNSTGSYELRIGGSNVLSGSGLDTQAGTHAYYDRAYFGSYGGYASFDDIYICNGAGSVNNDFLGNCHITAIFPDGDGNSSDFTPSAGDNYACIDEEVANDDTDYVESSTSGHQDMYTYDDLAALTGIKGLQINTMCRETDASSFSLVTPIRSGGADYDDSAQAIGTTDYVEKVRVSETDPDTSSAWTYTGVNSAEFGIEVD